MIALEVLKQTTGEELARAATALCEEGYLATVSDWNGRYISGTMYGGKEAYDIMLSVNRVYCSCPASRFQRTRCKHTTMFALSCLRAMQDVKAPKPSSNDHMIHLIRHESTTVHVTTRRAA